MSFNSLEFALFLPAFLLIFLAVRHCERTRDLTILIGSYAFYMSWYWQYAGLIALSTLVDHRVGLALSRTNNARKRKLLLCVSLSVNLGLLAIFKYFNFFSESVVATLSALGLPTYHFFLNFVLPVGISFYTFQTMSYTIDVYRRKIPHEYKLTKFAAYVSFFPQLVAGPIVRASVFLPQLQSASLNQRPRIPAGLRLVFIGLFKKIILADLLALTIVDKTFGDPTAFSSFDLVIALYAYAFQIYCDFSGYSDIAIGIALMIGFQLPRNFDKPYLAVSPSDFWRRWHITLSEWLRDYLYISLGGNRRGKFRTIVNLFITMLLGGLWHGASWNFVLWGAYHGALLAITQQFRRVKMESWFSRTIAMVITFHAMLFGWLLFRVSDMRTFDEYISGIADLTFGSQIAPLGFLLLATAVASHFLPADSVERLENCLPEKVHAIIMPLVHAVFLLLFVGASVGTPSFIYFQF